jgi:2,5-dihydroxypyridine 5,6-dioxygenase
MPTPANPGPLPIRSTGASVAIAGHGPTIAALQAADFVLDCTVEGLLHSPELGAVLGAGTRCPDDLERAPRDVRADAPRPRAGRARRPRQVALIEAASTMRVTSPPAPTSPWRLGGAFRAGSARLHHRAR